MTFAVIIAVNQIGIAATLINTLFGGIVFALALALGLAFGLGGRETAARMWQGWYQRGQELAPRVAQAAETAPEPVRQRTPQAEVERVEKERKEPRSGYRRVSTE